MTTTIRTLFSNTLYSILSLLLILIVCYYWIDIPTSVWVATHNINPLIMDISQTCAVLFKSAHWLIVAIVVGAIGLYVRYIQRNTKNAQSLLFFSAAVIVAFILCFVFKVILARYRPYMLMDHGLYGFHLFSLRDTINSMPSGHTCCSFAGFFALSLICHRWWATLGFMAIALVIALSRIVILQHYPSDVIFGAYLGILSVLWVQALMHYRQS